MSNSADSPLIRPATVFDRRISASVAAAKTNLGSPGVLALPLPGGQSLRASGIGGSAARCDSHHWLPTRGSATNKLIISANSRFNENAPSILIDEASVLITTEPPPELTINPGAGVTNYVYLVVEIEPVIAGTFVVNGTFLSATIQSFITPQSHSESEGVYTRFYELFRWKDGMRLYQTLYWNFHLRVRDDGTGTQTPAFHPVTFA